MRVAVFGTYDVHRHPRIAVIIEGLRDHGIQVDECNIPWDLDTAHRVRGADRPWLLIGAGLRLMRLWAHLWRQARQMPAPDAVIVGYLGNFDIHMARFAWRRTPIVLDMLTLMRDTAGDRGVGRRWVLSILDYLDRRAASLADIVAVDTPENLQLIPSPLRNRGVVVPVGASTRWFQALRRKGDGPLKVVFFGLYTPLQGTPVIGRAMALLKDAPIEWTMVGIGQDLGVTREYASPAANVTWIDWVAPAELPDLVADHHVCLGIFGTSNKAQRVVPNKVYQGAAAGCAIITSDTQPQRRALGDAAVYVPAGDELALRHSIAAFAADRDYCRDAGEKAHERAEKEFRPAAVVGPLIELLEKPTELSNDE